MSFPAAALIARVHSVPSILIALATMVGGCLVMLAAANLAVYPLVLLGLFMLASGITVLQVAANPLAAALGDPKRSHFRSEEHTSELQSLMRISSAVFCLKKKKKHIHNNNIK